MALTLLKRSQTSVPLTPTQHDANFTAIENAVNNLSLSGAVSQITAATSPCLFGRSTAGSGAGEELQVGSGLSLSGGVLSNTGAAGVGFASPSLNGGGSVDNGTTVSALAAGNYWVAKAATGYKFSSLAVPAGVHLAFGVDAYPVLDDGVVPNPAAGGRVTWAATPTEPGTLAGMRAGTVGGDFLRQGIDSSGTGGAPRTLGYSVLGWAAAGSYGLVRPHAAFSLAAAAATSSGLAAQLTSVLAAGTPGVLFVEVPGQEASTTSAATVVSRVLNVCFRALSRGIVVVLVLPFARRVATITTSIAKRNAQAAALLRRIAPAYGCLVYDPQRLLVDVTNANGDPLASTTQATADIINDWGARLAGLDLGQRLASILMPGGERLDRPGGALDVYDATFAPNGNLVTGTIAMYQGTGGTKAGANSANMSGTVPDSCTLTFTGGGSPAATGTSAVIQDANGTNWWVVTVTEGNTAGTAVLRTPFSTPVSAAVSAAVEIFASWNTPAYNTSGLEFQSALNYVSSTFQPRALSWADGPPGSFQGLLVFPDHTVPSASVPAAGATMDLTFGFAGRGSGFTHTFQIALPRVRFT